MMRHKLVAALAICAVAVASSCVSPEELRRDDEAACNVIGYLSKPFEEDDLVACIRSALTHDRSRGR